MDDVIISSNDLAQLQAAYDEALVALRKSGYQANMSKTQAPSSKISVFNLTLSKGVMKVTSQKMSDFLINFRRFHHTNTTRIPDANHNKWLA